MNKYLIIILLLISLQCKTIPKATTNPELIELYNLLQGNFTNGEQAKYDTSFALVSLRTHPIWQNKTYEFWLFTEQALIKKPNKKLSRNVYQIVQIEPKRYACYVYNLKQDENIVAQPHSPTPQENIKPTDLIKSQGCTMYFFKDTDGSFRGGTEENTCTSKITGVSYISSQFTITSEKIVLREQGFNENNIQVWGTKRGGYIFKKVYDK
ncbi:MAG: chromophore lyase CpcT/CpeT [Saprospiraceae bacterium]|nr:chromophore lyase CpcT/CpeT [Saprospiraceae bacterium]